MPPAVAPVAGHAFQRSLVQSSSATGKVRYGLALILLCTFFYTIPVVKTPLGYSTYPTLDDFASLAFVAVSLPAINSRVKGPESRIFRIMWLAIVLALPSVLLGYFLMPGDRTLKYGLLLTVHYCKVFLVFASATVLVVDERRFRRLLVVAWLGSIFVGGWALLQYFGVLTLYSWAEAFAESGPWLGGLEQAETRALGPLAFNHAVIGNYMVIALMISFILVRTARVGKPLFQLSIPFFVLVAILSKSRAGLAGVLVGLVVYMVLSKVRPAAIVGLVAGCVVTYVILQSSPELHERFVLTKGGKTLVDYSAGRLEGWGQVLGQILRRPYILLTGVGLGNFASLHEAGAILLVAAHNNYLHWLTECGIVGLTLPLLVLARLLRIFRAMTAWDRFHREIGIGLCSLVAALLWVAGTQENLVPSPSMGRVLAYSIFLFGAAVALYRQWFLTQTTMYPRQPPGRRL